MVKLKNILRKRRLLGLLASFSLLPAILMPATAQALGRLFFTPEQRLALDHGRQQPRLQKESAGVRPIESFSVKGMVRRNDGSITLWVSKVPDDTAEFNSPLRSGDDENVMAPGLRRKLPNRLEENPDEQVSRIIKPPSSSGGPR